VWDSEGKECQDGATIQSADFCSISIKPKGATKATNNQYEQEVEDKFKKDVP
jgi:hypothetical protein